MLVDMRRASKTRDTSPFSSLLAAFKFVVLLLVALPVVGQR